MARGVMIRCTNARFLELLAEGDSAGVGVLTCATQPSRGCIRDGRFFFPFSTAPRGGHCLGRQRRWIGDVFNIAEAGQCLIFSYFSAPASLM